MEAIVPCYFDQRISLFIESLGICTVQLFYSSKMLAVKFGANLFGGFKYYVPTTPNDVKGCLVCFMCLLYKCCINWRCSDHRFSLHFTLLYWSLKLAVLNCYYRSPGHFYAFGSVLREFISFDFSCDLDTIFVGIYANSTIYLFKSDKYWRYCSFSYNYIGGYNTLNRS